MALNMIAQALATTFHRCVQSNGLILAGVLAVVALTAACSSTEESQPVSPGITPNVTEPGSGRAADSVYRRADDLCTHVDFAPLTQVLGAAAAQRGQAHDIAGATDATCSTTLGDLPEGAFVRVHATTGDPGSGRVIFDSLRPAHQADGALTDIADLGSAAYTYQDELTGRYVITHDGNLYLTVVVVPAVDGMDLPADLVDRMTETARATMSRLRE
ncbi:hypothetical protein KBX50_12460 [Micromonospora sp. C51]|uniref:hypothetical protein n=1 Tax=Micromonospora sp. C51 TaxID=2824879 RepID=UPI001B38D57E|nr:hypothetical protein [Micromonospora sp. C51]MBQ1049269.1 hypothetical protein [Micromonospora sp. C51]